MAESKDKSLGQAIDELITALRPLDDATRSVAIRAACEHLGLLAQTIPSGGLTQSLSPARPQSDSLGPATVIASQAVTDIRTFKATKSPASALEMACVVAHYVASVAPVTERKDSITAADLDKYFRQADYPLPKRIEQVLPDARAAGYFDSAARGAYRLNPVGYNLVVHGLPRAASETPKRQPKPRTKRVPPRTRAKTKK
jgi:hypothetical protein